MRFTTKTHPLGWGDKEIAWLLSTGMNMTNIYRAMGYKGRVISPPFKARIERIKLEQVQ